MRTKSTLTSAKANGFTLAEVLITLGIIGIVAALTLPSLITNYREKQRVTQLKKIHSTLQQAFVRAQEAHGELQYWDLTKTDTGEVDEDGNTILDHSGNEKVLSYLGESLNAQKNESDIHVTLRSLNNVVVNNDYVYPPSRYLKLNDGTIILIGWVGSITNSLYADVQILFPGCERKGCIVGIDAFYFKLMPKVGIIPAGLPTDTGLRFDRDCNLSQNIKNNGLGCTAWVIYKENMDYLHCNDLSWNGKSKCKQ